MTLLQFVECIENNLCKTSINILNFYILLPMKVLLFFAFLIFKILCLYKRRVLPKSLSSCVIHSISYSSKTEYFYFFGFRDSQKYF